jgi:hypothetical protein
MSWRERWRRCPLSSRSWLAYIPVMSTMQKAMIAGFTAAERNYVRGNLDQVF